MRPYWSRCCPGDSLLLPLLGQKEDLSTTVFSRGFDSQQIAVRSSQPGFGEQDSAVETHTGSRSRCASVPQFDVSGSIHFMP